MKLSRNVACSVLVGGIVYGLFLEPLGFAPALAVGAGIMIGAVSFLAVDFLWGDAK